MTNDRTENLRLSKEHHPLFLKSYFTLKIQLYSLRSMLFQTAPQLYQLCFPNPPCLTATITFSPRPHRSHWSPCRTLLEEESAHPGMGSAAPAASWDRGTNTKSSFYCLAKKWHITQCYILIYSLVFKCYHDRSFVNILYKALQESQK